MKPRKLLLAVLLIGLVPVVDVTGRTRPRPRQQQPLRSSIAYSNRVASAPPSNMSFLQSRICQIFLDSRIIAQMAGLGQAACQRHCIFDKGVGYAIAFGIDEFVGHWFGLLSHIDKFGAE